MTATTQGTPLPRVTKTGDRITMPVHVFDGLIERLLDAELNVRVLSVAVEELAKQSTEVPQVRSWWKP
jgi:hypothetical protein